MKKTFLYTILIIIAGTAIALMTDIRKGVYQIVESGPGTIDTCLSADEPIKDKNRIDTVRCKIEHIEKFVEVPSATGRTAKIYASYKDNEANISDLIPVERNVYEYIQKCKDENSVPQLDIVVIDGKISSIIQRKKPNSVKKISITKDTILTTSHKGEKRHFVIIHNCLKCVLNVYGSKKVYHTFDVLRHYFKAYYTISPDRRYLYILGYVCANSNGWTVNYHLYKVDCKSLKIKEIAKCAAIKKTKRGFMIAKCRITNEDTAKCTADEIWLIHDVNIDWNGRVISSDKKEYDYAEMERRYSPRLVKGFKKI